jgi:hypothetical protein
MIDKSERDCTYLARRLGTTTLLLLLLLAEPRDVHHTRVLVLLRVLVVGGDGVGVVVVVCVVVEVFDGVRRLLGHGGGVQRGGVGGVEELGGVDHRE